MNASTQTELNNLLERVHTASLATLNAQGQPCCSYAPFIYHHGCFYLFLSGLAAHCQNLQRHGNCEILIIEDESQTKNLFARRRLMVRCQASTSSRESDQFQAVAQLFRAQFGPTVDMLVSLPDFSLFRLQPQDGTLVLGFGNATAVKFELPEQA